MKNQETKKNTAQESTEDQWQNFKSNYPTIVELDVQWGDMDAFGHINNVIYFRYFENVRLAFMNKAGFLNNRLKKLINPVLASTECRYRVPITYPDKLKIGCKTVKIGETDFIQEYGIYSTQLKTVTTLGEARVVTINAKTGRKVEIDDQVKSAIEASEKTK